jgi:glycosyltransferase involved in cell wall biosynthesis
LQTAAIIPVHNRPSLVVDAIGSVQRQTRQLDEIIIVDDGSTDETPDVVSRLSKQDSRIRLVALAKSGGASAARNVGIDSSQCDWISFLDSDDEWMPRKHEMQVHALANLPNALASFTGIQYRFQDGRYDVSAPNPITLQALRSSNRLGTTSTAMIRRSALKKIGGFDRTLPSCQDWDLWIKLKRIGEFAVVSEPLVVFNQTQQCRISRNREAVLAGHSILFARVLEDVSDPKERRIVCAHHQIRLAEIYLKDLREPIPAVKAALKSLILHRSKDAARILRSALKEML